MAPPLTGTAIESLDHDRAIAFDRDRRPWYSGCNCPGRLPALDRAAIEGAPIEACRKTNGLRFVLSVTYHYWKSQW
jgi:hypothetical protein